MAPDSPRLTRSQSASVSAGGGRSRWRNCVIISSKSALDEVNGAVSIMSQPTFCLNFYNNHSIALDSAKPKNAVHATEKVIPKPRPAS